jgi:hypothetical protein
MKLEFIFHTPLIRGDLSAIRYIGKLPKPHFMMIPLCVVVSPINIGSDRGSFKFKKHMEILLTTNKIELILIELSFGETYREPYKTLIKTSVSQLENWCIEKDINFILSLASPSWNSKNTFETVGHVTIATHYLENHIVHPGWAKKHPSKRNVTPFFTFSPTRDIAYIILWGNLGEGRGAYSDEIFWVQEFVKKIIKAARYYKLKKIYIDFRNTKGRLDFPLPQEEIAIEYLSEEPVMYNDLDRFLILNIMPKKAGETKINPALHDSENIRKVFNEFIWALDGLKA